MVVVTDFQIEPTFPLSWKIVLVYAIKSPHQVMSKLLHTFPGLPYIQSRRQSRIVTISHSAHPVIPDSLLVLAKNAEKTSQLDPASSQN